MLKKLLPRVIFCFAILITSAFASPSGTMKETKQMSVEMKINPQQLDQVNVEGKNLSLQYKDENALKPDYYARDGDVIVGGNNLFLKSNTSKIKVQAAYSESSKQVIAYMRKARDKDNSKLMNNKGDYTQCNYIKYKYFEQAAGSAQLGQVWKIEKWVNDEKMMV